MKLTLTCIVLQVAKWNSMILKTEVILDFEHCITSKNVEENAFSHVSTDSPDTLHSFRGRNLELIAGYNSTVHIETIGVDFYIYI